MGQPSDQLLQTQETFSEPLSAEESRVVRTASRVLQRQFMHEGPLPPPEMMADYERVLQGSAERIMRMAEVQSEHRQAIEKAVISGNLRDQPLGVWFAFALALSVIICGAAIALHGYPLTGFTAMVAALGSLIAVFVVGRRGQTKEREATKMHEED